MWDLNWCHNVSFSRSLRNSSSVSAGRWVVSDPLQPRGFLPLAPPDSESKSVSRSQLSDRAHLFTDSWVFSHFYPASPTLTFCITMCCAKSLQMGLTLCHSVDYRPPSSFVPGISQARILEWIAIPFSTGSSGPRDRTFISCAAGRLFTIWAARKALINYRTISKLGDWHWYNPQNLFEFYQPKRYIWVCVSLYAILSS